MWTDVAESLATDPEFGDSAAIERRALARLWTGMGTLAGAAPSLGWAGRDADHPELLSVLRDPVLRNAFETDMWSAAAGVLGRGSMLARFLAAQRERASAATAATAAAADREEPTVAAWPHLGPARVWTEVARRDADLLTARQWQLFRGAFPRPAASVPIAPTPAQRDTLRQAAELLVDLLPGLGPGVLRHIGLVVLGRDDSEDGPMHSGSGGDSLPATVVLAPEELADVWQAAGALLHEGLHLKLFEIVRCGAAFQDCVELEKAVVPIPWRRQRWSLTRVLFALHVYVHLAVFEEAVRAAPPGLRGRYGEPPATLTLSPSVAAASGYAQAGRRARQLADELSDRAGLLTGYGTQLLDWLVGALDRLSPDVQHEWLSARYDAVGTVAVAPLPEQQRAVLALAEPSRLYWLNAASWLIYALCDGRDAASIRAEFTATVRRAVSRPDAERQFADGLRALVRAGLVAEQGGFAMEDSLRR